MVYCELKLHPSYGCAILHCIAISQFTYLFIRPWYLGYYHFGAFLNNVTSSYLCISLFAFVCQLLGRMLTIPNILRKYFLQQLYHFIFTSEIYRGPNLSTFSSPFTVICLLIIAILVHMRWYFTGLLICICQLKVLSSVSLFHVLIGNFYIFFEEMSVQSLCPLSIGYLFYFFLLLNCVR